MNWKLFIAILTLISSLILALFRSGGKAEDEVRELYDRRR